MNNFLILLRDICIFLVPVLILIAVYKFNKFKPVVNKLDRLFYIHFLENEAQFKNDSTEKLLKLMAKVLEGFYIFYIMLSLTEILLSFDLRAIYNFIPLIFFAIIIPLMCRLVLFIQLKYHDLK